MSSLCCCWRGRAPDAQDGAAGEAANEMKHIEVVRTADCEQLDSSHSAGDIWKELLTVNPNLPDGGTEFDDADDEDTSKQWPKNQGNADRTRSVRSSEKVDLLKLINKLRADSGVKSMLTLSDELCEVAKAVWYKREESMENGFGFVVIPDCLTHHFQPLEGTNDLYGNAVPYDCLSYYDLLVHTRNDLAAVTFEYWSSNGWYSSIPGHYKCSSKALLDFPPRRFVARQDLDNTKNQLRPMLLNGDNTRLGVFFKMGPALYKGGWKPYCVIAIFAP